MAITHSDFLTQVRNYTEVGSTVLSDSQIQEFIRNVELDVAGKVDYDDLASMFKMEGCLGITHWDVPGPDGKFGFGGKCFPKDLTHFDSLSGEDNIFKTALNSNKVFRGENT